MVLGGLRFEPNHQTALNNMGVASFQQKEYATAAKWFHRLLTINPRNAAAKAALEHTQKYAPRWHVPLHPTANAQQLRLRPTTTATDDTVEFV